MTTNTTELEQEITAIITASDETSAERSVLRAQVDALYDKMGPFTEMIHHAFEEVTALCELRIWAEHPGWDQSKRSQQYNVYRLAVREAFQRVYHARLKPGKSPGQYGAIVREEEITEDGGDEE